MNNLENRLRNAFSHISNSLLTVCMVLGLGFAGVQAQTPEAQPASFYFKVGDAVTNEITAQPGDSFTLIVGFSTAGPLDGATATLLWDPTLLSVPGTQVTDLIGSLLLFPFNNQIDGDLGHLSFTKAMIGGYISPDTDADGNPIETSHDLMSFTVDVPASIEYNTTATIMHQTADVVDKSALTFYGASLLDYDNVPTFTVNIDAGQDQFDCPDLQANIGDACDDGDPNTTGDVVTADCGCAGVAVAPENDDCSGAIALECGTTVTGNTEGATPDDAGCASFGSGGNGVWYTITPTEPSVITLQTCLEGTNFDTDLNVYTGACDDLTCFSGFSSDGYTDGTSSDLPSCGGDFPLDYRAGGTFVATANETYYILLSGYGSDDMGDFALQVDCETIACESPSLALAAVANPNNEPIDGCIAAGSDYYVMATLSGGSGNATYSVSANGGDAVEVAADGSYTFGPYSAGTSVSVSATGNDSDICGAEESIDSPAVCAPSNDLCEDAIALECGETVYGNTLGATPDDVGCYTYGSNGNGVWYTYTPTVNSLVTLQTCLDTTNFDSDLNVYTGECGSLECFNGFSDDGYTDGQSSGLPYCSGYRAGGIFTAEAGVTYHILLVGYGTTSAGTFGLQVDCQEISCDSACLVSCLL